MRLNLNLQLLVTSMHDESMLPSLVMLHMHDYAAFCMSNFFKASYVMAKPLSAFCFFIPFLLLDYFSFYCCIKRVL